MKAAGAALGTLVAEAVVLLWHVVVLRKQILPMLKGLKFGLLGVSTGIAAAASFWIGNMQLPDFWTLAFSAIVFFGVYALALHIGKDPFVIEMEGRFLPKLKGIFKK